MINKFFDGTIIQAIVPKRRIIERRQGEDYEVCKTMFPGYVFVKTHMNIKTYYELKKIPGYHRLLNKYKTHNIRDMKSHEIDIGE
ncbi:transcription termination/antitermination NusG family protein [Paenibacillus sp. NPDC055715]